MCARRSCASCEAMATHRRLSPRHVGPVDERSAVRYVGVVIEDDGTMPPIESPVMPAPTITTEKAHAKAEAE
jgi:hypothetical protein